MKGLHGKPLGHKKLDICYSNPKVVSPSVHF
jgi:hypothetical protein